MTRMDWNQARAFTATAEAGSLSAAARRLGLTQPTLSRQVAAFEQDLGIALFDRVGKKLVLTPAGLGLLEHARAMAEAADQIVLAAAGRSEDITGRVSISATEAFATHLLPEILPRIRKEAPQVTIAIIASDTISDLRRREADIAIRHVRPTEPELIGRLVAEMPAEFYAAKSWIARHGTPKSPRDLARIELLGFEPVERFVEQLAAAGFAVTAGQCRIVSASAVALWAMLRRGLGVGMMLREIADRTPGLVRILPSMPPVMVPVWLVAHRELQTSRRVRIVFDIIAAEVGRMGRTRPRAPQRKRSNRKVVR